MYEVLKKPRLNFGEAFNLASSRLTTFSGRSRRSEYWWWYLAAIIISIIVGTLMGIVFKSIALNQFVTVVVLYLLRVAVTVRRLHDVGKNGFAAYGLCTLGIILWSMPFWQDMPFWQSSSPIISFILLMVVGVLDLYVLVMSLMDSEYENDYGASPKYIE